MTRISDAVIEAGAIAQHEARRRMFPRATLLEWHDLDPEDQAWMLDFARACLTAALAAMEREGVVCGKVPDEKREDRSLSPHLTHREIGWNEAIAEMRANRIGGTDEG